MAVKQPTVAEPTKKARELRARRAAARIGHRLYKVRFGPYTVVDESWHVVSLTADDLDSVEAWLREAS